ncbi:MAG: NAD-dependent epimerase/dehydratase family protein [Candidatus Omnitrophica bacterium]|nr:NAD-dependent epimerase/dehydratase family protein [Candidatus Omnitrophota bacterium]
MKILVTGGAGFIGSHLVDALVRRGHKVRVLDNLEEQVHHGEKPDYLHPGAEYLWGDVRDRRLLSKALRGIEILFHEAACVGVGQSMYQIDKYVDNNTRSASILLDMIVNKKLPIQKMVVASSMSIYGEGAYRCADCGPVFPSVRPEEQLRRRQWEMLCPRCRKPLEPQPTAEEKPLAPTSVYAITKRDHEELFLTVGRAYRIPTVALRYFNVYGPRQNLSNPYTGVCAIFSARIKNNNPPLIFEDGLQSRDFVHVSDIVQANLLVMKNHRADGQAFNVGTGHSTSILEIARTLGRLYGNDIDPEIPKRFRAGDIRHCYAEISKLRAIGFQPTVKLKDGLRQLVQWGQHVAAKDEVQKAASELETRGLTRG